MHIVSIELSCVGDPGALERRRPAAGEETAASGIQALEPWDSGGTRASGEGRRRPSSRWKMARRSGDERAGEAERRRGRTSSGGGRAAAGEDERRGRPSGGGGGRVVEQRERRGSGELRGGGENGAK